MHLYNKNYQVRLNEIPVFFKSNILFFLVPDNVLGRWLGNTLSHITEGKKVFIQLKTQEKATNLDSILACIPATSQKLALKLLGAVFTVEELARSNCTKVEGRDLLDPKILHGIRCKCVVLITWSYVLYIYFYRPN